MMDDILSMIAILVSVASAGVSVYTFVWTRKRDRAQATLEAYNRLQEQVLDDLNLYSSAQIAEIARNPKSPEYKKISAYIARIEHFCVGVNQKIYDCQVVYELAEGFLDGAVKKRIWPMLEMKNRSGHDYYENIHKVLKWMEAEKTRRENI